MRQLSPLPDSDTGRKQDRHGIGLWHAAFFSPFDFPGLPRPLSNALSMSSNTVRARSDHRSSRSSSVLLVFNVEIEI